MGSVARRSQRITGERAGKCTESHRAQPRWSLLPPRIGTARRSQLARSFPPLSGPGGSRIFPTALPGPPSVTLAV
jgi:hypothetical protein